MQEPYKPGWKDIFALIIAGLRVILPFILGIAALVVIISRLVLLFFS